jgi:ATP-dependent RNA helicase DDX31/DBP7
MRGSVPKVMVFLSSCESVEFHYKVLSWLAGEKETTEKDTTPRPPSSYAVFRLHGVLSQSDRRAVYAGFAKAKAGVLLCTDVGARGLDFENVGATVQVDPPSDPETYVHRVGRAARLGADGEAVIFLAPRETEYAQVLSELGVKFGAASVPAMLDVLETGLGDDEANRRAVGGGISHDAARARRKYESDPHLHPAAMRLQKRLHAAVARDAGLSTLARDAFRAHVRAYATFPAKLKHIFHVKRLHLGHVAAAFGLKEAPGLIGKSATRERLQAAKDKKRKDALKAKTDAKEKRKRRAEGKSAPRKAARGTVVGV